MGKPVLIFLAVVTLALLIGTANSTSSAADSANVGAFDDVTGDAKAAAGSVIDSMAPTPSGSFDAANPDGEKRGGSWSDWIKSIF